MHVQSCCFDYKTYCFLTFSSPSESLDLKVTILQGSLSNNVYERRTSTGNGLFSFFDDGFAQSFSQIATIRVKKLSNTNFISSRHINGKSPHFRLTSVAQKRLCLYQIGGARAELLTLPLSAFAIVVT